MKKFIQKFMEIIRGLRPSETPAIDFEKRHGITGIAGHYVFPKAKSRSMLEIETKLMAGYPKRLLKIWDRLVALNPELGNHPLKTNTEDELYDAIVGVVSGFNVDDILYYQHRENSSEFEEEERDVLMERFEAKYGRIWGWYPSITTLKRILNRQSS